MRIERKYTRPWIGKISTCGIWLLPKAIAIKPLLQVDFLPDCFAFAELYCTLLGSPSK